MHQSSILRFVGVLLVGLLLWTVPVQSQDLPDRLHDDAAPATIVSPEVERRALSAVEGKEGEAGSMSRVGLSLSRLHVAFRKHVADGQPKSAFRSPSHGVRVARGSVVVDAVARRGRAAELEQSLVALGMRKAARRERMVSGWMPIDVLDEMAALPALHSAYPSIVAARTGAVTSRGVPAMRTDDLRTRFGDGAGVTIGVLSDSFNKFDGTPGTTAEEDVASGDLPPLQRINVLAEPEDPATDEGRAMIQLIHDVAPGAQYVYHTAVDGLANFANGIIEIANAGATVIVDDIIYLGEPAYQDGLISTAIDQVVYRANATYVTAAGNNGRDAYESPFRPSGQTGRLGGEVHDFDPGPGVDGAQTVRIDPGTTVQFALHWSQPYASTGGPGAETDLEVYLLDTAGGVIDGARAERRDNVGGDPFEFVEFTNEGIDANGDGRPDGRFQLVIERMRGPAPERVRYTAFVRTGNAEPVEYDTNSPSLYGHPNTRSAITVGATAWFNTPLFNDSISRPRINSFSSVGGVPILFSEIGTPVGPDLRLKPDVTGPDGGNTTFFGQQIEDGDTFPNFFGTSAAAPHVAGLAAILKARRPDLRADEVKAALVASADDILRVNDDTPTAIAGEDAEGFDFFSGAGFVRADRIALPSRTVEGFRVASAGDGAELRWTLLSGQVASFQVEESYLGTPFAPQGDPIAVSSSATSGASSYAFPLGSLRPGTYAYRLTWRTTDGDRVVGPSTLVQVSVTDDVLISRAPFPNPATDAFQFEITAQERQGVIVALYDVLGRRVGIVFSGFVDANRPQRIRVNRLDRFGPGRHFLRIKGEQFETSVPVTIVR